ncbi:hypothetical protein LXL04_017351 [Taraxacum kok-saghyz]
MIVYLVQIEIQELKKKKENTGRKKLKDSCPFLNLQLTWDVKSAAVKIRPDVIPLVRTGRVLSMPKYHPIAALLVMEVDCDLPLLKIANRLFFDQEIGSKRPWKAVVVVGNGFCESEARLNVKRNAYCKWRSCGGEICCHFLTRLRSFCETNVSPRVSMFTPWLDDVASRRGINAMSRHIRFSPVPSLIGPPFARKSEISGCYYQIRRLLLPPTVAASSDRTTRRRRQPDQRLHPPISAPLSSDFSSSVLFPSISQVYGNYTVNMMNRCMEKRLDGELMLPITWPMNSDTDLSWSFRSHLAATRDTKGNWPPSADVKKQTVFLLQIAYVWTTSSSAELCRCGPQTANTKAKPPGPFRFSNPVEPVFRRNRPVHSGQEYNKKPATFKPPTPPVPGLTGPTGRFEPAGGSGLAIPLAFLPRQPRRPTPPYLALVVAVPFVLAFVDFSASSLKSI